MSTKPRNMHLLKGVVLATLIGLTTSACGTQPATPAATPAQAQWAQYAKIADRPAVKLDWRDHPAAPKGFTDKDMDTFAKIEVSLISKSFSQKVAQMSPDDAIAYVMTDLTPATEYDYTSRLPKEIPGKHSWEWFLASLYKDNLTEPSKIIRVDWNTETRPGKLDDGTPSRYLNLTLQVFAVQTLGPKDHPRNIIVSRAVRLSGFKPNGGPAWWPGFSSKTFPYGNDGCALGEDSTLRPLRTVKYLKEDLVSLRKALAVKGVPAWRDRDFKKSEPKAIKAAAAFCAKHKDGM